MGEKDDPFGGRSYRVGHSGNHVKGVADAVHVAASWIAPSLPFTTTEDRNGLTEMGEKGMGVMRAVYAIYQPPSTLIAWPVM